MNAAKVFLGAILLLVASPGFAQTDADVTTMNRKLLFGYQGWFACPGDGSAVNSWVHWFHKNNPTATNATVDFWPDISELETNELFSTGMTLPDGAPAKVYSAFTQKTVLRHFRWMQENNLDGVFLQRFTCELSDPRYFALRNQVAANVQAGAEKYGRTFAMMYDISGQRPETLVSALTNDWNFLTHMQLITSSPRYLRHNGKPVVAIWGFGFADRPGTMEQAREVIQFFKSAGCTVVGGVPIDWRKDPAWQSVFEEFDVISPWAVGAFGDDAGADSYRERCTAPDLATARQAGRDYMPVIFPGFSWHNLHAGKPNQIPRRAGKLFWRQAFNAVSTGCPMIYCAMFDEVDEGTAMFKLAPTKAQLPVEGKFVPLNVDSVTLPSDWYLRLANEAGKMLRGEIPVTNSIPITP